MHSFLLPNGNPVLLLSYKRKNEIACEPGVNVAQRGQETARSILKTKFHTKSLGFLAGDQVKTIP